MVEATILISDVYSLWARLWKMEEQSGGSCQPSVTATNAGGGDNYQKLISNQIAAAHTPAMG